MSCVYFAAILTILPPSWRKNRYFLLYITGHGLVRARKYVVVWQKRAGPGSFMLAPGGPGCKSAGPCHLSQGFGAVTIRGRRSNSTLIVLQATHHGLASPPLAWLVTYHGPAQALSPQSMACDSPWPCTRFSLSLAHVSPRPCLASPETLLVNSP